MVSGVESGKWSGEWRVECGKWTVERRRVELRVDWRVECGLKIGVESGFFYPAVKRDGSFKLTTVTVD